MKIESLRPFLGALNYRLRSFGNLTFVAESDGTIADVLWMPNGVAPTDDNRRGRWTITCDGCSHVYADDARSEEQTCPKCGYVEGPRPDITSEELERAAMGCFFDLPYSEADYEEFVVLHCEDREAAYVHAEAALKAIGIRLPKRKGYGNGSKPEVKPLRGDV